MLFDENVAEYVLKYRTRVYFDLLPRYQLLDTTSTQ